MDEGSLSFAEFKKLTEDERCERYKDLSDHDKLLARISMDPGARSVPCNTCAYYRGSAKCDAFGPDRLITGEHIHKVTADITTPCSDKHKYTPKSEK